MGFLSSLGGWFGFGGALGERKGQQSGAPSTALVSGAANIGPDGALQRQLLEDEGVHFHEDGSIDWSVYRWEA